MTNGTHYPCLYDGSGGVLDSSTVRLDSTLKTAEMPFVHVISYHTSSTSGRLIMYGQTAHACVLFFWAVYCCKHRLHFHADTPYVSQHDVSVARFALYDQVPVKCATMQPCLTPLSLVRPLCRRVSPGCLCTPNTNADRAPAAHMPVSF